MSQQLWKVLWHDKRVKRVLLLALLIRMLLVGYLAFQPQGMFATSDSWDYHRLALNLLHHRVFSDTPDVQGPAPSGAQESGPASSPKPELLPDHYRTPVYPTFLALVYALGGTSFTAVVIQSGLGLVLVWEIMLLAARMLGPDLGWRAGLFAALEPMNLIYSHKVMSDVLFGVLMVAGVYVFYGLVTTKSTGWSAIWRGVLGGLLTGLAILTRPVATFLPFVLIALAVIKVIRARQSEGRGKSPDLTPTPNAQTHNAYPLIRSVLAFVLITGLIVCSWGVRNYMHFNRFFITTAFNYNVLMTITAQMVAKMRNPEGDISSWQMFEILDQELTAKMASEGLDASSEVERTYYFRNWSMGVIRNHPSLFARYLVKGTFTLYLTDIPGFFELLGATHERTGAWGSLFRQGLRPALHKYFGERWPYWVLMALPLIVFDVTLYTLVLWGTVKLWLKREFFLLLFFWSMVAYWVLISAIGALPRYRFPQMPFLIILAAWGWTRHARLKAAPATMNTQCLGPIAEG